MYTFPEFPTAANTAGLKGENSTAKRYSPEP